MAPTTDLGDWLLLGIRWVHLLAATVWVGGGLFYLLVLRPALRRAEPGVAAALGPAVGAGFREVVNLAIASLVVSGAVLTFDRLSRNAGLAYAAVLALKVALAIAMFALAWELGWAGRRGARGRRWPISPAGLLLVLGLVVFLLALVLRGLVQ
jgi:putative copper export protein